MSLWWPVDNPRITGQWANSPAFYAKFGMKGHNGIDLGMATGTPVYASDAGVVHFEGWGQNMSWMGQPAGICVLLRHSWGYTGYAHMSRTIVDKGQSVQRGQLLGYSGNTGASLGPHLHWETLPANPDFRNGFAGRVNPNNYGIVARGTNPAPAPAPAAHQRVTGPNPVNRRLDPNTSRPPIQPELAPNTVADFNGWIRGESVNGNNIWFRGAHSGNWFWSGGFTSQSTAGLQDLNPAPTPPPAPPAPAPANPAERTVGANPVRKRDRASVNGTELGSLPAGSKHVFDGWAKGMAVSDSVASTDIWYHSPEGWWSWAGGFTNISANGLKDMTPAPPAPPTPTPEPTPEPTPPTPTPEPEPTPTRQPVSKTTPNWDASSPATNPVYPLPEPKASGVVLPDSITQRTEAVSLNGYTIGRPDPKGPNHIVLHHAASASLSGTINTLRGTNGAPTANYVVSGNELVEMVPENSSAWTNGRWTSNLYSVTFEMVNASGSSSTGWFSPSAETMETTAWAMARAAQRWNIELPLEYGINVFGHKEVSKTPTACPGGLDIKAVVKRANEIIAANPVPSPEPEPTVDSEAIADSVDIIVAELTTISNILRGEK